MSDLKGKLLITGGRGFIGQNFLHLCASNLDLEVITLSRGKGQGDFQHYSVNMLDNEALKRSIINIKPTYVLHLAANVFTNNFDSLVKTNVLGTYHLLQAIAMLNMPCRVLLANSSAVYGMVSKKNMPISESQSCKPVSNYGLTKKWMSELSGKFDFTDVDIIEARIFNLLGPGITNKLVAGAFFKRIMDFKANKLKKPLIFKELSSIRDFLDVRDVCSALYLLLSQGRGKNIYNVCSNEPVRIERLLKVMIEISSINIEYLVTNEGMTTKGINVSYGDNTKLIKQTGWQRKYSLEESVKRMFNGDK